MIQAQYKLVRVRPNTLLERETIDNRREGTEHGINERPEIICSQVWNGGCAGRGVHGAWYGVWAVRACGARGEARGRGRDSREQRGSNMGDTYLKQHEAPEDIEYYLCGPPMMAKTVLDLLHSLGVSDEDIRFDNFG